MENQTFALTLDAVKECIAFDKNSGLYKTLCGLCDCWFGIAKQKGLSDEDAAKSALDSLGEKMLEMAQKQWV